MTRLYAPATPRPLLDALIEAAKTHEMTPAEMQQQSISFVFGSLSKSSILTRADVENAIYARHGNLAGMEETIKSLTSSLAAACEVIQGLLPMAEQAETKVPHHGSCGPWESCDADCMQAHHDSKTLCTARDFIKEHAK